MKNSNLAGAKRFRAEVADLLQLPSTSDEPAVRNALRSKGPSYIEWYDTRLGAIAEFEGSREPSLRSPF